MSAKANSLLHVAVCQLTSIDSVAANVREIERLLNTLSGAGSLDLVCFPENALYLRVQDGEPRVGLTLEDEGLQRLSRWAVEHQASVHIGSVPLIEDGKFYNASLLLRPDGRIQVPYRKIHLFDVDVVGHKPLRESDFFAHGPAPSVFEINGWKFGSSICYDVRFAELYSHYAREQVDVILIPSAFLVPTGRAHWDILVRARAIESQAFVLAAAQGGRHVGVSGGTRETYGHSLIVDPWGQVLAECREESSGSQIIRATLDAERITAVRRQIPMRGHRRL